MVEIIFGQDKRHRDKYFSPGSFAHPAKMMLPLQRWLIEKYSMPGDVILDPMAGQGTLLIGCTMGRHVILVELESKFVGMLNDNWTKIQTLGPEMGYEMGTATILQGDARNLADVLADVVITSPPYQETRPLSSHEPQEAYRPELKGDIKASHSVTEGQIANLPYGNIDCVITSPPYEGINTTGKADSYKGSHGPYSQVQIPDYRETPSNIGNLKGESYLSAMLEVYQGCCRVLRPQGWMVLITKNFIREKLEIRLDLDTIKLCEQAGFQFVERHYRKLTSQSFWRTIYRQKYPDAPVLDKEDVLVFKAK